MQFLYIHCRQDKLSVYPDPVHRAPLEGVTPVHRAPLEGVTVSPDPHVSVPHDDGYMYPDSGVNTPLEDGSFTLSPDGSAPLEDGSFTPCL